jgi:hypothetical protein
MSGGVVAYQTDGLLLFYHRMRLLISFFELDILFYIYII